ncbi:MAG: chemotaxis protein CheB, partial [Mesorhizobium sp.]
MLASIIQRCTAIETKTAAEGLEIEPDHIYVTPPGVSVTVEGRRFHVAKMTTMRARRMPIDDFFASLAHDQAENTAGIILSGTG